LSNRVWRGREYDHKEKRENHHPRLEEREFLGEGVGAGVDPFLLVQLKGNERQPSPPVKAAKQGGRARVGENSIVRN